ARQQIAPRTGPDRIRRAFDRTAARQDRLGRRGLMLLWRLSSARRAADFDGGFGLFNDGRWNTRGHSVTYCATVPSLAALEKRVHVADPALLPPQVMVAYDVPDGISVRRIEIDELPANWVTQQTRTQRIGDGWLDTADEVLLSVPSVIVPIANAP